MFDLIDSVNFQDIKEQLLLLLIILLNKTRIVNLEVGFNNFIVNQKNMKEFNVILGAMIRWNVL